MRKIVITKLYTDAAAFTLDINFHIFLTTLLCCVGDGALTQAAWRLWGLLLGDLPKLPERGPGCPALGVPSGASGPRGPCQPQSSCGSVASGSM